MEKPKLTQFSHGSGCGCKIAPADLERILNQSVGSTTIFEDLLVGNGSNDDAAVMELDNGNCLISTTDFFTPIVDDALDFGSIAAANAISDVYAMGGKPLMAVAILGWPVEQLGTELASQVISGARKTCEQANIPLAGGHSIDSKEPFFGLAVTGQVETKNLKRNNTAKPEDILFLTKPLGTGILSTAMKRGMLKEGELKILIKQLTSLNSIGERLGKVSEVHAMTDVTGFGLLGHLLEMCKGSNLGAEISFADIPTFGDAMLKPYLDQFIMPDNTMRNFKAFNEKCTKLSTKQLQILCDPQTNGGLLISASASIQDEITGMLNEQRLYSKVIGKMHTGKPFVSVQ